MAVKDFFSTHGKDIAMALVFMVGLYFTIQTNVKEIELLKINYAELEAGKVSNTTMELKEHFLGSELERIEDDIGDLNRRLDNKIKIIKDLTHEVITLRIDNATKTTQINGFQGQLSNIWDNYNRINCK